MLPLLNRFAAKPLEIIWKTKQNLDNFLGHQEGRHYHRNLVGIKSISRPATIYKTLRTWVTLLSCKRKNKWSHCDLLLIEGGSGKKKFRLIWIFYSVGECFSRKWYLSNSCFFFACPCRRWDVLRLLQDEACGWSHLWGLR